MSTFPLLVGQVESFEDHMDTLFKVVHVGPVATGIQVGGLVGGGAEQICSPDTHSHYL